MSGSFIDKFLSNNSFIPISTIGCFSDHLAIQCYISVRMPYGEFYRGKTRRFGAAPLEKIYNFILLNLKRQIIPIHSNLTYDECERLALKFDKIFETVFDKYVPNQIIRHNFHLSPEARAVQKHIRWNYRKLHRLGGLTPEHIAAPFKNNIKQLKIMLSNTLYG